MSADIFRHDMQSASELGLNLQGPPILSSRRTATQHAATRTTKTASVTIDRSAIGGTALPAIVLQLPELAADADISDPGTIDLAGILSWVAIGLGAIVAAALIWTAPTEGQPSIDEAPAWNGPSEPGSEATPATDAATGPPATTDEPSQHSPESRDAAEGAVADRYSSPPGASTESMQIPLVDRSAPVVDEASRNAPQVPEGGVQTQDNPGNVPGTQAPVHTARSGEPTWDGAANRLRPGEAAPVGRIINVGVSP